MMQSTNTVNVMISDLIRVLEQPGLMPGMEDERQKLLQQFYKILPVLPLAQLLRFDRDFEDEEIAWLRRLKTAAYKADGIIDEFRYAKLQTEVETDRRLSGDKVRTIVFSLCKLISGMRLPFKGGMRERLTGIIGELGERWPRTTYGQRQVFLPRADGPQDLTLSSQKEIDAIIIGRDEEKEQIVNQLLDLCRAVRDTIAVLSIVGDPGVGKTTLTRLICGDVRIKDNFEVILWVDVGEFDVARIAKSVIDQVIGKDCCLSEGDTDLLGHRIYRELSGKRYLLVLDSVPYVNNEKWEQLKLWLEQSAASGSSLIITSSDDRVPKIMSSVHTCELSPLRKDDLWTLFCRRAFIADKGICQQIGEIYVQQIFERCGGSPVLVNLMGGLMRFRKEPAEWLEVINQLTNCNSRDLELRIMELCINYLSSEIKECFAFCSAFPKGHYMDQEVLVKLWMANGLISSNGPTSVEERGNRIFNELVLRHFFEDVKLVPKNSSRDKHGYHSRVICKMHGKIHSLAKSASQYEYIVLPVPPEYMLGIDEYIPQIRCLSIPANSPVDIPELLKKFRHLRTLISHDDTFIRTVNCSVLPKSNSLRVLHLHSAKFDRDLFELKYIKHLRYLDLSGSRIRRLPQSTSSLYFLQSLNLSKCLLLCHLQEDMRYMRSLRHLYVDECPKLKKMPVYLGQLSFLKTLTTYIVGESVGNGIDEIKSLDLGGLLEIYNLRKVKNAAIAREANLFLKTNLERLTLCWGRQQLVMSKKNNDFEVLKALRPHNGLKVLKIQQYGGYEFANWLAYPVDLPNLVELHLIGCSQCSTIPIVWKLRSLRVLCLKHMINLTCMSNFTSSPGSSELFPSLKRLVLVGLKRLERWHEGEAIHRTKLLFPMLDEMEITKCPKLKTMPSVPVLKYLTISIENHGLLLSAIDLIAQLESLVEVNMAKTQLESLVEINMAQASGSDKEALLGAEVDECNNHKLRVMRLDSTNSFFMDRVITHLQLGFWRSLVSLENLDIFNCSSIVYWPLEEFRNLGKLKRLSVRKCPNLTGLLPNQLKEGEELLPLLQSLEFYGCLSLKEVPKCSSILYLELDECPEINSISGLNNLKMLFLSCTNWTSLPTGLGDLKKLEFLQVSECYSLTCLPNELESLMLLQTLIINKCSRVKSLPEGLDQMLSSLGKFQISECPDLEKFCEEGPYSSIISQIGNSPDTSTDGSSL